MPLVLFVFLPSGCATSDYFTRSQGFEDTVPSAPSARGEASTCCYIDAFSLNCAEVEQSIVQLKLDLERSNDAPAMLQSSYDKKEKFCEGLRSRNVMLHKNGQDAKSSVKLLEEGKEEIEKKCCCGGALLCLPLKGTKGYGFLVRSLIMSLQ
jgi:hypothetical protein